MRLHAQRWLLLVSLLTCYNGRLWHVWGAFALRHPAQCWCCTAAQLRLAASCRTLGVRIAFGPLGPLRAIYSPFGGGDSEPQRDVQAEHCQAKQGAQESNAPWVRLGANEDVVTHEAAPHCLAGWPGARRRCGGCRRSRRWRRSGSGSCGWRWGRGRDRGAERWGPRRGPSLGPQRCVLLVGLQTGIAACSIRAGYLHVHGD